MNHSRRSHSSLLQPTLAMVALAATAPVRAQCANSWLPVTPGPNNTVRAMTSWDPDGPGPQSKVVVVGGEFTTVGGMPANGLAIYDPVSGTWSTLPSIGPYAIVSALAVMANGDLVAAGSSLGANYNDNLVRWNGSSWTPFGTGVTYNVAALLPLPNGDLIVGGYIVSAGGAPASGVAKWNGSTWSTMPGLDALSYLGISVRRLAQMSNGDIVAGGMFTCSGGAHLARWNGTSWTGMGIVMGSGLSEVVQAMVALPNNRLVVAQQFGVLLWNGATWSGLASPNSMPDTRALTLAPSGDLIAGGYSFVGVARWDGTAWSTLGSGTATGAQAFAWAPNGDLLVGGNFLSAGGVASPNIVRVTTSCPASVATYGAGCAGTGGLNAIDAVTLPWIGSTFRARAVGMPPLAFVLSVYGFTPLSIPFASVFPQGLPGCTILMNGDLIDVLLPSAGAVDTQITLPDVPALVGAQFHHYVVPFEVDPALNLTAITSSNALTCTVGAF